MFSSTPFKVFLSFHSYFELIIFPWGYKGDPCPNYVKLLQGGIAMAKVRIYAYITNVRRVIFLLYLFYKTCTVILNVY